ncbi:MAG: T9SS type A sorting domain-containing protein [Chloroherpetonaceae bacterium]|nr:T9SS type A sorting domain-containing protein [Chloroherpetonaceae bacterium]
MKQRIRLFTILLFLSFTITKTLFGQFSGITGTGDGINYTSYGTITTRLTEVRPFGTGTTSVTVYIDFWQAGFNGAVNLTTARLYYKTNSATFGTANDASWTAINASSIIDVGNNDRATFNITGVSAGTDIMFYVRAETTTGGPRDGYAYPGQSSWSTTAPSSQNQTYKIRFNKAAAFNPVFVDGNTVDWQSTSQIADRTTSAAGRTLDIMWDDTCVYVLVNSGFTASAFDRVHVGFDRNPGSGGNANGTTTAFNGASFPENYRPDIIFRARGTGSSAWTNDRGVANGSNGWTFTGDIGNTTASDVFSASGSNTTNLEIKIRRSAIGAFTDLGVFVWFGNGADNCYDSYPNGNPAGNGLMPIQIGFPNLNDGSIPNTSAYFDGQYGHTTSFDIFGSTIYRNLRISNSGGNIGLSTALAGLTVNGNLQIDAGGSFRFINSVGTGYGSGVVVNGNAIINGALTLSNAVGGDLRLAGDWTLNTGGSFTSNGRSVAFFGSSNQSISGTALPTFAFFDVDKSTPTATVTLNRSITLDNGVSSHTLWVRRGVLNLNGQTLTLSGSGTKRLEVRADGATVQTGGTAINTFGEYHDGSASGRLDGQVLYNGAGNESMAGCGYDTLVTSGGGTKTITANGTGLNRFIANTDINAQTFSLSFNASPTGVVEIYRLFQTANTNGFSHAAGSAISSTNLPSITLGPISIIEYNSTSAGQAISSRTDYNVLRINNTAGNVSFTLPSGPLTYNSASNVTGNITADSLQMQRGLLILSPSSVAATYDHNFGTIVHGSSTSTITGFPTIVTNTSIINNNLSGATVNTTVTGNFIAGAPGAGGVDITLTGASSNATTVSSITIGGNFDFSVCRLTLTGKTGFSGAITINFDGNVNFSSSSNFNGNRGGTGAPQPQINLRGTSATVTIPRDVWIAAASNAICDWSIPSSANITLPNGSAIVVQNGYTLTLNGTLNCENGSELIATLTGGSPSTSTFTIGSTGLLRLQDPQGLGDGVDSTSTPLFYKRSSPGSPGAGTWTTTSLNTNGTIEYYGANQTVTPRSGSLRYNNLQLTGSGTKTLNGNTTLNGGATLTVASGVTLDASSSEVEFFGSGGNVAMNGTFRTSNANGFSGGANTAIRNTNSPTITLGSNTTLEYSGSGSVTGGSFENITILSGGSPTRTLSAGISLAGSRTLQVQSGTRLNTAGFQVSFSGIGGTVDLQGILGVGNTDGFTGSTTTAISNTNTPSVTLGSSSTIDYNAAGDQTITARTDYQNLNVSGGGQKTLGGNVTVGTNLGLGGGYVIVGSNTLLFASSATAENGSNTSHVVGPITHTFTTTSDEKEYPIGDGTTLRGLRVTGATTSGTATVAGRLNSFFAGGGVLGGGLTRLSAIRHFQFQVAGNEVGFTDVNTFRLNADDDATSSSSNSTLRIATKGDDETWQERTLEGAPVDTDPLPVTLSADEFDAQTVASGNSFFVAWATTGGVGDDPLPVELSTFVASSTPKGFDLNWETKAETESYGFILLRRKEGEPWKTVATYRNNDQLKARNNSTGATYQFLDAIETGKGEKYYYRLQEVGFSGAVDELRVIQVESAFDNRVKEFELSQNYPNPFNPTTTISFDLPQREAVIIELYDVLGRKISTLVNETREAGRYSIFVNAGALRLSSGVYFYRLQAGSFSSIKKMMLTK